MASGGSGCVGVGSSEEKEDEADESSGWDEAQLNEAFDRWDHTNNAAIPGEAGGTTNHNNTSQQDASAFIARLVKFGVFTNTNCNITVI